MPSMWDQYLKWLQEELDAPTQEAVYDHINNTMSKTMLVSSIFRFMEFYYNG